MGDFYRPEQQTGNFGALGSLGGEQVAPGQQPLGLMSLQQRRLRGGGNQDRQYAPQPQFGNKGGGFQPSRREQIANTPRQQADEIYRGDGTVSPSAMGRMLR